MYVLNHSLSATLWKWTLCDETQKQKLPLQRTSKNVLVLRKVKNNLHFPSLNITLPLMLVISATFAVYFLILRRNFQSICVYDWCACRKQSVCCMDRFHYCGLIIQSSSCVSVCGNRSFVFMPDLSVQSWAGCKEVILFFYRVAGIRSSECKRRHCSCNIYSSNLKQNCFKTLHNCNRWVVKF